MQALAFVAVGRFGCTLPLRAPIAIAADPGTTTDHRLHYHTCVHDYAACVGFMRLPRFELISECSCVRPAFLIVPTRQISLIVASL